MIIFNTSRNMGELNLSYFKSALYIIMIQVDIKNFNVGVRYERTDDIAKDISF